MTASLKLFAAVFYTAYFLVVFVWPSLRTYRQTGINPVTFDKTDKAHDFIGRWFKILLLATGAIIAVAGMDQSVYAHLLPFSSGHLPVLRLTGVALCLASLVWTSVAQWQMGRSWRIGIDEKNHTALKTKGLFAVSRNPIFLGMMVTLLGIFFLLPNAFTLLIFFSGYLLMQIVVRLEEAFLLQKHGFTYHCYKMTVRRWI